MQVTPSRIFLSFCCGILVSIAVATTIAVPVTVPWMLAGCGALLVVFGFPRRAPFGSPRFFIVALSVLLLGSAVGMGRAQFVARELSTATVVRFAGEDAMIVGTVSRIPQTRIDGTRFLVDVAFVDRTPVNGRILVFSERASAVAYGDRIVLRGKIRLPQAFDDFNYPAFLAKDGIVALVSARDIVTQGTREGSLGGRFLANLRSRIDEVVGRIAPFREGAILKALLLGEEGDMADEFKVALNRAGLRHIVAVSGMNMTILIGMAMGAGLGVGLWRRHAFFLATGATIIFVALIGFPASAVRAAIMGLSMHAALIVGRRASGFRATVVAASAMAFLSPLIVWYDVGFQLSFLAILGIIFLAPVLRHWFRALPGFLGETLAMTFAAQFAVLPLLVSVFGRVSLIAPVTNMIVVPFLPLVTVWGTAAVAAGFIAPPLGTIMAAPLLPYISFVTWVAERSAAFSFAELSMTSGFSLVGLGLWAGALMWIVLQERRRHVKPIDLVGQWTP